jgi:poly(3-hydroxybutyrate) depolymerase
LHGCCDTNESWVEQTDIGELTRDDGVIVAMPFAGTWPHWERELHRAWPILAQALGV